VVWDVMGQIYNLRIYDAVAELYDHIVNELKISRRASILDVGTGRGYISFLIAAKNPKAMIMGIDYSPMQVRTAQKLLRQKQIPNCPFQRGNAMAIQFQDKAYDAAVSVGSIKHWPDGLRGMKEIYRVLKPGGWCIIAETDQEATNAELWQFVRHFRIRLIPASVLFWGLRHVVFGQSYSQRSLTSLVSAAGFRNVECQRVPTCPYVIIKAQK